MAANRHLPHALAAVHERRRVPHRAELLVGAIVVVLASVADIRGAIGFSSFCVLFYYAVANISALTLRRRLLVPAARRGRLRRARVRAAALVGRRRRGGDRRGGAALPADEGPAAGGESSGHGAPTELRVVLTVRRPCARVLPRALGLEQVAAGARTRSSCSRRRALVRGRRPPDREGAAAVSRAATRGRGAGERGVARSPGRGGRRGGRLAADGALGRPQRAGAGAGRHAAWTLFSPAE